MLNFTKRNVTIAVVVLVVLYMLFGGFSCSSDEPQTKKAPVAEKVETAPTSKPVAAPEATLAVADEKNIADEKIIAADEFLNAAMQAATVAQEAAKRAEDAAKFAAEAAKGAEEAAKMAVTAMHHSMGINAQNCEDCTTPCPAMQKAPAKEAVKAVCPAMPQAMTEAVAEPAAAEEKEAVAKDAPAKEAAAPAAEAPAKAE